MGPKAWLVVLGCGVLVGALHAYPDVRFRAELGSAYEGIPFMGAADEGTYLSRVKRASLGDWRLGNAMIYEHRHDPWIYGPAGEVIEGRLARWLGLSVGAVDIICTFALPMLLMVIAQQFFFTITTSTPFSLLGAMTIALGQYLLNKDSPLLHGQLTHTHWTWPLQLVRPISPQFYLLPFLLGLWSCYQVFLGKRRTWAVLAGLSLGVQLYTNLFFWSFLVTGLSLLAVLGVVQRRMTVAKGFLLAAFVAIVCGIPYGHNLWLTVHQANYQEAIARLGVYWTRQPIFPLWHVAVAGTFIIVGWGCRYQRWYQFVTTFLLVGFICLNQQVLTGRTFTPFHWETQTNKVLLEIALVVGCWKLVRAASSRAVPILTSIICGTGMVVLMLHGWALQTHYFHSKRPESVMLQPLGRPLRWLSQHTQPTDVVLVNPLHYEWAEYVTTISGNYTYISESFSHASFLSRREIERRYLGALRFFRATPQEVRGFIRWFNGAHFLGLSALPWYVPTDPTEIVHYLDDLEAQYQQERPQSPWNSVRDYKLDYVLMSTDERAEVVKATASSDIDQVYDDGRFVIWRVMRTPARGVRG